jgi:hypothetical protein
MRNPNNIFISCENISRIFQIFDLALGKSEKHINKSENYQNIPIDI